LEDAMDLSFDKLQTECLQPWDTV